MNGTHSILGIVLLAVYLVGIVMIVIGAVRMLISAFRTSILWGLGCLFLPFCMLIYLISHWEEAKSGFFLKLKGIFVLAIALVVAIVVPNWQRGRAAQRVQAKEHIVAAQPDKDPSTAAPTNSIEKDKQVASAKNPTAATPTPAFRLQGIMYNPARPSAVINGNTVLVGDKVAGWSVTAISDKSVTLQNDSGGTKTLSMN